MSFIDALMKSPILQMALLAGIGASITSGVIGAYVVVKRIVSISGSIAHSVLSGMGIAAYLKYAYGLEWLSPFIGALIASILSALIIGWVHLRYKEREDAIISMIWSIGMAIGVIATSQIPGFNVELGNFLLGNILWVTPEDLILLYVLGAFVLLSTIILHKRFLAICFDEKQARLQGLNVEFLYLFLLVLVGISVVVLINIVGVILVLSMLALPASMAGAFSKRLSVTMAIAVMLNIVFSVGGLAISYRLDWPTGATIALFAGVFYLLNLRFKRLARR